MLLEIFKSNKRIVGGLIVLLSIILWVPGFFVDGGINVNANSVSLGGINFLFEPKWLNIVLTSILIGGQGLFLNYTITTHKLLKTNSYLVALFYVLLNGCGLFIFSLSAIIVANSFVLLAVSQLFKLYNLSQATSTLFNLGLFVGLASIIYFPFIVFFFIALFSLSYICSPKGRDFLVVFIGAGLPFLYWGVYLFLTNDVFKFLESFILFPQEVNSTIIGAHYYFLYAIGAVGVLSFIYLLISLGRNVAKTRKLLVVVLVMTLVCGCTLFFTQKYSWTYLVMIIPGAIVIANFMENIKKRWQRELIFYTLVFSLVLDYFL